MQAHLGGLIENLLVTAELEEMEQTRERLAAKREEIEPTRRQHHPVGGRPPKGRRATNLPGARYQNCTSTRPPQ